MQPDIKIEGEPRWPAAVAILAIGGVFYELPPGISVFPHWLVLLVVALLMVLTTIFHQRGMRRANQISGYLAQGVVTLSLATSLVMLVLRLPGKKDSPGDLLRAAAALWVSNMLVFASWYWRLDAGGPNQRDLLRSHTDGAFLFPQMVLDPDLRKEMGEDQWRPGFVDYLFLAFNTSTAFSPTDVPVLSRWAKVLMMLQSSISLTAIAILGARAVNIL
jgi:hypothetical protein